MSASIDHAVRIVRKALDAAPDDLDTFLTDECADDAELRRLAEAMLCDAAGIVDDVESRAAADTPDPLLGQRLGAFRVLERIGRGGMGVVYRGEREGADFAQTVALKLIRRGFDFDEVQARFLRERRILSRLSHPNLARFIDGGVAPDGRPWFALEFVQGQPILAWCDARRLGVHARVRLFLRVCAAVQYAHTQLVVHRDLKPGNVLVHTDGTPRLLDFGISRLLESDDGEATLTVAGYRHALTPEYAAPEQFGGEAGIAADVYSLGAILYQLVSGVLPYPLDRRDLAEAERIVRTTPPQALSQAIARLGANEDAAVRLAARSTSLRAYRAAVRGDLQRILDKALAKEPERRYATVEAFADDLSCWLDGTPVRVSGNALGYRFGKFVRRNRWGVAMAGFAAVVVLAAGAALAWQADHANREAANAIQLKDYVIEILHQYDGQNAASGSSALRSLDAAARRMQSLTPGSEVRLELLCVLLDMYAERNFEEEGLAIAARELPVDPDWRHDTSDAVRLRAYVLAAWLRKEAGQTAKARDDLERVMQTYPHAHDAAYAEAMKVIGESWADEHNFPQAAQWQQAAMHLFERTTTPDDARLLYSRTLAGNYLAALRRAQEGRALVERALDDLPAGDSKVRVYLCAIGALQRELSGEFESARTLLLENRDVVQRLGYTRMPEFYASLRMYNDFATGRLVEAKTAADAVILGQQGRMNRRSFAASYVLRGEISYVEGDAAGAANDFAAAVNALGPEQGDADVGVYARAMQAISLAAAGQPEPARNVLPATDGMPGSYATVAARAAHGRVLEIEGRHADALSAYQRALDELDSVRTQPAEIRNQIRENRVEIRLLGWRAHAECEQGDAVRAGQHFRQAVQRAQRILGQQHPYTQELLRGAHDSCAATDSAHADSDPGAMQPAFPDIDRHSPAARSATLPRFRRSALNRPAGLR